MTRFAGYRLLACPHCQTVHAVANLVSFNLMSFETWTDGQKRHALLDYRQGVRQCSSCEQVLLESEAKFIGHTRQRQRRDEVHYQIPDFLLRPAYESSWSWEGLRAGLMKLGQRVLRGGLPFASADSTNPATTAVPIDQAAEQSTQSHPDFLQVADCALANLLENASGDSPSLVLALRKLYWRYLNDPYRDKARRFHELGLNAGATFAPTELQLVNMRALLALVYHQEPQDAVTLAELHRELGEFEAAIDLLCSCDPDDEEANTIRDAASNQIAAPLPVIYAWLTRNCTDVD